MNPLRFEFCSECANARDRLERDGCFYMGRDLVTLEGACQEGDHVIARDWEERQRGESE